MSSMSVVIPVYNAEASLDTLYQRRSAGLQKLTDTFENLMVEGHGRHGSWAIVEQLAPFSGAQLFALKDRKKNLRDLVIGYLSSQ